MNNQGLEESEIESFLDQVKTRSVSTGCFVYKGKKKTLNSARYFGADNNGASKKRLQMYQQLWSEISDKVQSLQNESNHTVLQEVVDFCQQSGTANTEEIPTAALLTGVNMPDHDVLFSSLTSLVRRHVTDHVALLQSKECSHLKSLTQSLIEQVTAGSTDGVLIKRSCPTIAALSNWYHQRAKVQSPKKRRGSQTASAARPRSPVVIILSDLERFDPVVVQDFIIACSEHRDKLPVVLILGVATAVTTVHRLLPHSVSNRICLARFQAPPSSGHFSIILAQTIMTSSLPFKLGRRVFQHLVDLFLIHDFSITNYASSLQFLLMEHFYSNPASILCCTAEESASSITSLSSSTLTDIRQCASFMKFVETAPPETQRALLLDDGALKDQIKSWLSDIHHYHQHFFPIMKCLHILTSHLPRHPLGRQEREVYCRCLDSDIYDEEDYKTCFSLLRSMCRDEMMKLLEDCITSLSDHSSPDLTTVSQSLNQCLHKLRDMEKTADEPVVEEAPAAPLPKKMDMPTLRKRLKKLQEDKKMTVYQVLRNQVLDYLDGLFRSYLYSYKCLPLYECFYQESSLKVRQHINAAPLTAIHQALTNPQHYLQCESARSEFGSIGSTLPDVSIVYKLHLESGRLINLYDWLQAFVTIVSAGKKTDKQTDSILQARFIRAVCELQFLGFVKPTKRKTDHVQRLTW